MDEGALVARWSERQARLEALLHGWNASGLDYAVDLQLGRFAWRRPRGALVVVASTRFLASYALSNRSVLAGWDNQSIPPDVRIPECADIPAYVADASEEDAWMVALHIADALGAHYIYRAPSPQSWAFLGLWDVRKASADDAPLSVGSPWPFVSEVLETLAKQLDAGVDIRAIARGYGRTIAEDFLRRGTSLEAPLRAIGERIERLPDLPPGDRRDAVTALIAEVQRNVQS